MCPCDHAERRVCDWCADRIRAAAQHCRRDTLENWFGWKCEAVLGPEPATVH